MNQEENRKLVSKALKADAKILFEKKGNGVQIEMEGSGASLTFLVIKALEQKDCKFKECVETAQRVINMKLLNQTK